MNKDIGKGEVLKEYTVVGSWADNGQPFVEWAMADTPEQAVAAARQALAGDSGDYDPNDTDIIAIFAGHHLDLAAGMGGQGSTQSVHV